MKETEASHRSHQNETQQMRYVRVRVRVRTREYAKRRRFFINSIKTTCKDPRYDRMKEHEGARGNNFNEYERVRLVLNCTLDNEKCENRGHEIRFGVYSIVR